MTGPTLTTRSRCLLPLLGALAYSATLQAAPVEIDALTVNDQQPDAREQARLAQRATPGHASLIDQQAREQGRQSAAPDVLRLQPGVYAQSAGNDGIRLSIRGSSLNRAPGSFRTGVYYMFDGLPLTGPDGTPYELLEPLGLDYSEVFRGPAAFAFGPLNLGGALNQASLTGEQAARLQVRYEVGSQGYRKRQISSGQVLGNADYYVSLTDSDSDGYQRHAKASTQGIAANVGYRFNSNLETRFYLRYRETENQLAGRITLQQVKHDPRAANAFYQNNDSTRPQPGSTWFANKTTLILDQDSRLELGAVYHDYPMDHREGLNRLKVAYTDISGIANYIRNHSLFGHDSSTRIGWRTTKHLPNSGASEYVRIPSGATANYPIGTKTRDYSYLGSDSVLTLLNELALQPGWWLHSGLSLSYIRRESSVSYPEDGGSFSKHEWDLGALLGLRYQPRDDLQFYGSLSRSVEPPNAWSYLWSSDQYFSSGVAQGLHRQAVDLDTQNATTLDLGSRGEMRFGRWNLGYYYSQVRHESLIIEVQPGVRAERNASPTLHQGIEASLDSTLWQAGEQHRLALRQAYTLNDFQYRDDERFKRNELAGIPRHVYQAELNYRHGSGLYLAVNTQYASKMPVDYANSFYTETYQIFGATLGYATHDGAWNLWLDARNLENKRYAAIVVPDFDVQGQDSARMVPGESRGLYAGVEWRWL